MRRSARTWPGCCAEITAAILKTNLIPGARDRRGIYLGPIDPKSPFAGRTVAGHSWLAVGERGARRLLGPGLGLGPEG